MSFVDELNSMKDNNTTDETSLYISRCINAIKNKCKENHSQKHIDGYLYEHLSHDGIDYFTIGPLPQRYSSKELKSKYRNEFVDTVRNERGFYNYNYYGGYAYFIREGRIDIQIFKTGVDREMRKLGFTKFAINTIRTENEIVSLTRSIFKGDTKAQYKKTGEWGYLIHIEVQW